MLDSEILLAQRRKGIILQHWRRGEGRDALASALDISKSHPQILKKSNSKKVVTTNYVAECSTNWWKSNTHTWYQKAPLPSIRLALRENHGVETFFNQEISHIPALFLINFASSLIFGACKWTALIQDGVDWKSKNTFWISWYDSSTNDSTKFISKMVP